MVPMKKTLADLPIQPMETETIPWLIAHRGHSLAFPENTSAAFKAALAVPIDAIELDLQWTKDEVVVCYHDRTLTKIGGGRRRVRNQTYQELRALDAGAWFGSEHSGEKILRLEELLTTFAPKTQLLLEIKRREGTNRSRLEALLRKVVELIYHKGFSKRVAILCFDEALLRWGASQWPELRYVLNQDWPVIIEEDDFLFAYDVRVSTLTREFVISVHQRGKKVFTYSVNKTPLLKRVLAMGVDGIMSDDPVWLFKAVKGKV